MKCIYNTILEKLDEYTLEYLTNKLLLFKDSLIFFFLEW